MANIETDTDGTMREIANFIVEKTLGKFGFAAMVFDLNTIPSTGHYISNCNRHDMIKYLREEADTLEKKLDLEVSSKNNYKPGE